MSPNDKEAERLIKDIDDMVSEFESSAKNMMQDLSNHFVKSIASHLATQGRSGGEGVKLSPVTLELYKNNPELRPTGALASSLVIEKHKHGIRVSIPPEMEAIASIQEYGAIIHNGMLSPSVYVPGRQFWSNSIEETEKYGKNKWSLVIDKVTDK